MDTDEMLRRAKALARDRRMRREGEPRNNEKAS